MHLIFTHANAYLCLAVGPVAPLGGEESPGNLEHQAPEIGGRGNLTDSATENYRRASAR